MTKVKMLSVLFFLFFMFASPVWAAPFAYIPNLSDDTVSVIDTANNTVVKTITVGNSPIAITMKPDGSRIYVLNISSNNISVIDTNSNKIVKTISFSGANSPQAIAVTPDGSRLYMPDTAGTIRVISTYTGKTDKIITLSPASAVVGIAVSPNGQRIYATGISSKIVFIIDANNNHVVETVSVEDSPVGVIVSPDNSKVYVTNLFSNDNPQDSGSISVINTANNQVMATIQIGIKARAITISRDGSLVYAGNWNTIHVIDTKTNTLVNTIPTGNYGRDIRGIAITSDGLHIYAGNRETNNVTVFNANTNNIVTTIPIGNKPYFGIFIASGSEPSVDVIRPNITITNPTSNSSYSTFNSTITVGGNASDQGRIDRIEFYLNSSHINSINVNATSYNWSKTFALRNGSNTIIVKAYDVAGNWRSDTLTVNQTTAFWGHPRIEVIDAPSTARVGQSYTIRLRATDPNNNLSKIKVDWRAIGNWETRYVSNGQTVSLTYQYPRSGTFTWMAAAVDSSGRESYAVQRSVTVKSSPSTSRNTGYRASSTLRRSQPAQCRPNCLVADPIDTATGAQVLTHELLSVNGLLPISATLSYNSLLLTKGVVGRSWSLNGFDMRLQVLPSGDIEVHWSANRSNVFKNQGNGQFSGTDLVTLYDKLVSNADDSFTLTRQNKTVYQFDTNGWLVAFRNQKGQSLEFKQDNAGRLVQITEPVSGVFLKYAYNNNGLLTSVTDSLNRQVHLGYDSEHNLITITDAAGQTMTYTYNEFGQTLTGTNGDGVRLFTNTYDSEGRIIAQDDSVEGNQLFGLSYDETSQPNKIITTVTNRNGSAQVFTYDDNYQLLSLRNSLGKTTSYTYANGRHVSETDANGNSTRFAYDSEGNLAAITNAANLITYLSYDNRGNLLLVKNPLEQITRLAYDANNNVIRQTDQAGQMTRFEYNATQQLIKVIAPNSATTTYTYSKGRLSVITDVNGNSQSFAYDAAGRVIGMTDANKQTTTLTYDPINRLRSITDPLNRTVEMTYDSRDNLLSFKDAQGNLSRRVYDGNGNLSVEIGPLNRETQYQYDGEGQLIKLTNAAGQFTQWQRDADGRVVKMIAPSGAETQWVYDAVGNVTKTVDAVGQIVEMAYDVLNNPIKSIDAAGFATTMTYDTLGRLVTMTNALGFTVNQTYDVRGHVQTVQDAMGNSTRYVYDVNGNLINEINTLGNKTVYQYDAMNRLVAVIDAKGNKTRLVYDAKGRVVRVIDPLGRKQKRTYDTVDNVVTTTDPLSNTVQTHYDKLDNPNQVTDALGRSTVFEYDVVSRLTQFKDALNRRTQLEYDDVDRLIASVDALNGRSSQAFDLDGNRVALTDPNEHQTQFEFDPKNRLIAEVVSSGGSQHYGYNARDLLTDITNARGQKRQINYDALGRITQITDADGIISYAYDRNGNVLTVSDENGTIEREYDALNRVTKYTDTQGNTIQYAYDEVGNLVTLIYPHGKPVHYGYDAANQLITVIDWAGRETGYEWDANGRLVKEIRPNGTVMTRRYDKAGQLVQQQDVSSSGEVIAQFDFTYDAVGNITNETPALKPPVFNATMTYTTANRLATYNGEAVEFDADGNMTTGPLFDGMTAFRFDSRNRLIGVADTVYRYDAENQRVAVSVAGATSSYVINPQAALSQVLVRTAPSGTTYYVYGLGLIWEETNSNYQAYHYDLRGSTVALTDSAGTVVDRFAYSAFAQLVSHPDGLPATPFLYNGRDGVMTDANGLYYMRARFYSPEIRRFVNQDVLLGDVGDGQSLNRYAYVSGNPVSFVDPFGYDGVPVTYSTYSVPLNSTTTAPTTTYSTYSAPINSSETSDPYSVTDGKNLIKLGVYAVDAYADSTGSHKLGHYAHKIGNPTTGAYLGYSAYSGYQENGLGGARDNVTVDSTGFAAGHAAAKICVSLASFIPEPRVKIVVSVVGGVVCYFLVASGASALMEDALEPCYNAGEQFGDYLYDQSPSDVSTGLNMMWEDAWSGNLDIWWFGY